MLTSSYVQFVDGAKDIRSQVVCIYACLRKGVEDPAEQRLYRALRQTYGGALLNGPFAFLFGFSRGLMGLSDRIKLRPLVAAHDDDIAYIASEECAIREICPKPERVWRPKAGEPVIAELKQYVTV